MLDSHLGNQALANHLCRCRRLFAVRDEYQWLVDGSLWAKARVRMHCRWSRCNDAGDHEPPANQSVNRDSGDDVVHVRCFEPNGARSFDDAALRRSKDPRSIYESQHRDVAFCDRSRASHFWFSHWRDISRRPPHALLARRLAGGRFRSHCDCTLVSAASIAKSTRSRHVNLNEAFTKCPADGRFITDH